MYHDIKYKDAIKKITSTDELIVAEGIKILRDSGRPDTVNIVVDILNESKNEIVSKECIHFLNDIKDQKAAEFLVKAIENKKYKSILKDLVSCAWQNDLDFSHLLETFADVALNEEYIIAYEAFSVIENNIHKADEVMMNILSEKIKKGLGEAKKEKQPMLKELLDVINSQRII